MTAPPLNTRKPTGKPVWPTLLLAGVEGAGKTTRALFASRSPLIHRTFVIVVGEDDPDEYGIYDGVDFEIVEHDGTYRGILGAVDAAARQDRGPNGEPNLIILDAGHRLWGLLQDTATATMIERLRKRAERNNRRFDAPDPADLKLTPDLWNLCRDRWYHVLDTMRWVHQGPAIITSKLRMTTVFENGEPTKDKEWDQKAQFDLPGDVHLYVQMRAAYPASDDWLVRAKSARYDHSLDGDGNLLPEDWSVEWLWHKLGLGLGATGAAAHHQAVEHGSYDEEDARRAALLAEVLAAAEAAHANPQAINTEWAVAHNGQPIQETTDFGGLELLRDDLLAQAALAERGTTPEAPVVDPAPVVAETPQQQPQEAAAPPPAPSGQHPLVTECLGRLAAAQTLKDAQAVWSASKEVRDHEVTFGDYPTQPLGKVIMAVMRDLAGSEPQPAEAPSEDHGTRTAGENLRNEP